MRLKIVPGTKIISLCKNNFSFIKKIIQVYFELAPLSLVWLFDEHAYRFARYVPRALQQNNVDDATAIRRYVTNSVTKCVRLSDNERRKELLARSLPVQVQSCENFAHHLCDCSQKRNQNQFEREKKRENLSNQYEFICKKNSIFFRKIILSEKILARNSILLNFILVAFIKMPRKAAGI